MTNSRSSCTFANIMTRQGKAQKKNSDFIQTLHRLKKLKKKDRCRAISMANDHFIRQLCQHVKKLRCAKLSTKAKKELWKYRKTFRALANKRTSMSKRRKLLTQHGGNKHLDKFLSILSAPFYHYYKENVAGKNSK